MNFKVFWLHFSVCTQWGVYSLSVIRFHMWWWDNCFIIQELGESLAATDKALTYIWPFIFRLYQKLWHIFFSLAKRHLIAIYHFSHKHMTIIFPLCLFFVIYFMWTPKSFASNSSAIKWQKKKNDSFETFLVTTNEA